MGADGIALPDMPFSNEAYVFAKDLCMQRDVEIKIETIDRVGNFVGWIFLDSPSTSTGTNANGSDISKSSRKKKKNTDVSSVKQRTNLCLLLLAQGFGTVHRAPVTERSPYYHDMIKAEEEAKTNRYGLWSSDQFVKEWESEANNFDLTATNGAEDGNLLPLGGVSEYLDDLAGMQIGENDSEVVNNENTKVFPKIPLLRRS